MKKTKGRILKTLKKTRLYILGIIIMIVLAGIFYYSMRKTLLENYQEFGTSLAKRYSAEIAGDINLFRGLLEFGTYGLDYRVENGQSEEEINEWIVTYYNRLEEVLGNKILDPYIVLDGKLIGANPWAGDNDYDYSKSEWYQKAVAADHEVIFTNIYTDAITGRDVLTIAQQCLKCDSVVAFDVFPQNMEIYAERIALPENSSVYICDGNGEVIYCDSKLGDKNSEKIRTYVKEIYNGINNGTYTEYDAYIVDPDGDKRGVYHESMDIGWNVYITIPFDTILSKLNKFGLMFAMVIVPSISILIIIVIRYLFLDNRIERADETVKTLGNRYYALYRVNYNTDTYEMIKGSDYIRAKLSRKGSYSEMLKVMEEIIEPDAYKEFCDSFSSGSIKNLVLKNQRDYGGDFRRLVDNQYRWFNVRILFDDSLDSNEVVLSFQDIDAEKHHQFREKKLLQEALASSKRSEKTKQAFFSNMSHDMRTPLNAILSLSDLTLQNSDDPEKVQGYVQKISYSGRQLLNLVNDILSMSRMEQGKVVLSNQNIDLEKCIIECAEPFKLQAEAESKNFNLEFNIKNKYVFGDPNRINQILNNLLSNAFKFTEKGDTISVSVKQFEGPVRSQYQVVVSDTGIGMSEEFLPQLFEPYARETRFSNKHISGTGLGMPIVKNLITEMSGQITVKSKLGVGTEFTITLPFVVINAEEHINGSEDKKSKAPEVFSLQGKKILLAEDNVLNMEIAVEILSMNGIEVVQAWNGKEALDIFKNSTPFEFDAVLMDMQMPQMDGCEAAQRIRALSRPDAKVIPIIAVTANAFAEDIAATTAAGMDAHISKPIDFKALCRTLEQLTDMKRK